MRARILFLLLSGWLCCSASLARADSGAGDWRRELVDAANAIVVETRLRDDGYSEFRGTTRVSSTLTGLVALMRDVEHMPQWVYRTSAARILEVVSERELIIYSVARTIWPFNDRDLVTRTRLQQDSQSLQVAIDGESVPDLVPHDPDLVRVPYLRSQWVFKPVADGEVEVSFSGYGDGGGLLSTGLLNWFSRRVLAEAPHQTLLGLRAAIGRAEYQRASLPYVLEPGVPRSTVRAGTLWASLVQRIPKRASISVASSK